MKKVSLTLIIIIAVSHFLNVQFMTLENTTSTTHEVGIGTTAPNSTFQMGTGAYKFSDGNAAGVDLRYGTPSVGFNSARKSGNWNK